LFSLVTPHPVAWAASGPDCSWYEYQSDAQTAFDKALTDDPSANNWFRQLDPDGDGIACSELPPRPAVIESAVHIGGHFDPDYDYVGIRGSGYSTSYDVRLAGVTLDVGLDRAAVHSACADLVTNEVIFDLFEPADGTGREYYIQSATKEALPPGDADENASVIAWAWTIFADPANPVLINEWLIRNGLAFVDTGTVSGDGRVKLEAAQDQARADGLGVWGACTIPAELVPAPPQPESQIIQKSGDGDQIVRFAIPTEGTYLLTLDVAGGQVVFVAADLYTIDGGWFPEFSIVTSSGGQFTAAGYLAPGEYYLQVKAVGSWRMTMEVIA
jgi:hypothetical protein